MARLPEKEMTMQQRLVQRLVLLAVLMVALVLVASTMVTSVAAQERGGLRFEKTVSFAPGDFATLDALVGPVKVSTVEFTEGSGSKGGKLMGKLRSRGDASTKTNLRASFEVENPVPEEWEVSFTIDLLDPKGKLIDRFSGKKDFDGEARVYHVDHTILNYVIPLISKAEIKLEARLD